jgi:hypothetical protein
MKLMSELRTLKATFRKSNPAVIGVTVTKGTFRVGESIFNDVLRVDSISQIQIDGKNADYIKENQTGVISLKNVTVGKEIKEERYYTTLFETSPDVMEHREEDNRETKNYLESDSYIASLSSPIRKVDEHVKCKFCGEDVQRDYQNKFCDNCLKGKK